MVAAVYPTNPRWQYGDAGDRIPVVFCDIWKVGPHVFACGDLTLGHSAKLLELAPSLVGRSVDMVYTDPPWDGGAAQAYRTKAGYDFESRIVFQDLHDGVVQPLGDYDVYVEGGVKHCDEIQQWFRAVGFSVVNAWEVQHRGKFSCWMFHIHRSPDKAIGVGEPEVQHRELPTWAIERSSMPGDLVYDPCMGLGMTALAAAKLGRLTLGLELNPRRLAVAIDRICEAHGYKPQKIGQLQ